MTAVPPHGPPDQPATPQQGWSQPVAWPAQQAWPAQGSEQQSWGSQQGWAPQGSTALQGHPAPQGSTALQGHPAPQGYAGYVATPQQHQQWVQPSYPTPQFPTPPRPPQRGAPGWLWAVVGVLVVAVVLVFAIPSFVGGGGPDPDPDPTATTPPDDGFGEPNTSPSGTFTGEHMVETMNTALAARDRGAFFRFVDEDALAPLTLWWDNMDVLQWTAGAFSVAPGQADAYADDLITLRVTLGAATAGSPVIPEDSDHPDAGRRYAPSNLYDATIRVTDDGASGVLVGWEVAGTAAPWDLEPIYAVVSEHAVTAGYADEQELVDRVAPLGDIGATWVIETYEEETGVANSAAFTTFVTEDPDRFNDWFIADTSGWVAERAGTMFPQRRPFPAPGIPDDIATGSSALNAGGLLTIGPNGLLYGEEDTQDTIVHEFVHAMHMTNTPNDDWAGSTPLEGWAVYNESLFRGDGVFGAERTYIGRTLARCVSGDGFTGLFPTQADFDDADTVHCAYMLSGSIYAYAASLGVDVYEASDVVMEEGLTLPEAVASLGGPVIDEQAWAAWVVDGFATT